MIDKRVLRGMLPFVATSALAVVAPSCDTDSSPDEFRSNDKEKDPKKGCEPNEVCVGVDCPCDEDPNVCDVGLFCNEGLLCAAPVCNDGVIEGPEECEDGNLIDADGCDADCSFTQVVSIDSGALHTCALLDSGVVRCFGSGYYGQIGLGLPYLSNIGDNELPSSVPPVPLDTPAVEVVTGYLHTCALLESGHVRCWGQGNGGQLGYSTSTYIGDNYRDVNYYGNTFLNERAVDLSAHRDVSCAILESGALRCWGYGPWGALGAGGNVSGIGSSEFPTAIPPVAIDEPVIKVASGHRAHHTCALTASNQLYCFGRGWAGQLGDGIYVWARYEPGAPISAIAAGLPPDTAIIDIAVAEESTCVAYETGQVQCWGHNEYGQLGRGDTNSIGDDETPSSVPPIDLGGRNVIELVAGGRFYCARFDNGEALCWGRNQYGQLGRGQAGNLGDDETLANVASLDFGGHAVLDISGSSWGACFLLDDGQIYCTGYNTNGQLGHGSIGIVGIDNTPYEAGPISLY